MYGRETPYKTGDGDSWLKSIEPTVIGALLLIDAKKRQSTLNMHQSLSATIFPGYRRRVRGLPLLRPDESLHGREMGRRIGLPAGTLTRELKRLAEVGLLKQDQRGNQVLYSANRASPIFWELGGILRKMSGLADVVAETFEPRS